MPKVFAVEYFMKGVDDVFFCSNLSITLTSLWGGEYDGYLIESDGCTRRLCYARPKQQKSFRIIL